MVLVLTDGKLSDDVAANMQVQLQQLSAVVYPVVIMCELSPPSCDLFRPMLQDGEGQASLPLELLKLIQHRLDPCSSELHTSRTIQQY